MTNASVLIRVLCMFFFVNILVLGTLDAKVEDSSKKSGFIDESFYDDEEDGVLDEPDPFEGLNRITFGLNRIIDGLLFNLFRNEF